MFHVESHGPQWSPTLGEEPSIHPQARITDSSFGPWTFVNWDSRVRNSTVGAYTYFMERCQVTHSDVGKFCSIASDVRLNPGEHPLDRPTTNHLSYRRRQYDLGDTDDESVSEWRRENPVDIGHDVWIGHSATVMSGCSVGRGAVVAANAVVTDDVDPYTIVAGVPAEPIGKRFSEEVIERLEATEWWDWSHETLAERIEAFEDLETFLDKYAPSEADS